MQGKWIGCAYYRHRPFRVDGICLFCNSDTSPETLALLLADQERMDYYQALHQRKECQARKCEHAGCFDDGLGHWWCKDHVYQCLFLRAGAARDFSRWKEEGLSAGRPAWYARTIGATQYNLRSMLEKLIDARSPDELERYIDEYVANALGQRESVVVR